MRRDLPSPSSGIQSFMLPRIRSRRPSSPRSARLCRHGSKTSRHPGGEGTSRTATLPSASTLLHLLNEVFPVMRALRHVTDLPLVHGESGQIGMCDRTDQTKPSPMTSVPTSMTVPRPRSRGTVNFVTHCSPDRRLGPRHSRCMLVHRGRRHLKRSSDNRRRRWLYRLIDRSVVPSSSQDGQLPNRHHERNRTVSPASPPLWASR